MDDLDYWTRAKKFIKQFKFMGDMGAYFFFWSVGEDVPEYEVWMARKG
jgi:hypothetical protein